MTDAKGNADPLLTAEQVAEWLQVSEGTVNQWAKLGKLPVVKVGVLNRFRRPEIEEWLQKNSRAVEEPAPSEVA